MGGNIPCEDFLAGNFPRGRGEGREGGEGGRGGVIDEWEGDWWMGIFRVGVPPGGIFLESFSSYNVSILIFWKDYQQI